MPHRSPRCIIQAQSLGVLPCPLAALFPHASKTDDTMQYRIHCIYDDIPFLVRRHSQHDFRCLCPCRPRCYCPLAFAEVLFRSSSRTPILSMEKGHVTDSRIECPCCLPHLMLSGVPGMTTPATDDLLIMNVTPVCWCWHHFCPDVSHFSLAWLPCSPRTTTIMCCAHNKSFAFLCKTSLIQFFIMLTLITHVDADEERQKHASPFAISLSRVLDRPSGWESVPRE